MTTGKPSCNQSISRKPMEKKLRIPLGVGFIVLGLLLAYMVFVVWPRIGADASGNVPDSIVNLFGYHFGVTAEIRIILVVMVIGAIGSYVHAVRSFANFAGGRRLVGSWFWWYIFKIFIGVFMALLFYCAIRGGFLAAGDKSADINVYGVAAVAGMVGMFSDKAARKLADVFDSFFGSKEELNDKLTDNPNPDISKLDVKQGENDVTVNIFGNDFVQESIARFDGKDMLTKYISKTQLAVSIPKSDIASSIDISVTVFNPPPGGGTSDPETFKID